jgi:hypothetical protein
LFEVDLYFQGENNAYSCYAHFKRLRNKQSLAACQDSSACTGRFIEVWSWPCEA